MNLKDLLKPTKKKRLIYFLLVDSFIIFYSLYLSFFLRFEFNLPEKYYKLIILWFPIFLIVKISLFWFFRLYSISWRFISLEEFFKIGVAHVLSFLLISFLNYILFLFYNPFSLPRSIPFIDFFISLFLISLIRATKRLYVEKFSKIDRNKAKRTLIIGAGITGENICRELLRNKKQNHYPVAFLDDNPIKQNVYMHNVPVIGKLSDLEKVLKQEKIESVIIAIPDLPARKIREIFNICKENKINDIKIVPSVANLPKEIISVKDLKDINLEDLLARETIKVEEEKIKSFIENKTIFVSGAAGSIGSEIVRQLLKFTPYKIIAFEIDETELHNLTLEINNLKNKIQSETIFIPIVGDIKDSSKLENIFSKESIDIVFHAAAYKHVPLMEFFPEEAIKTNVFGTYNLAKISTKYNVKKFVNISTDKAVNPTSIMGATKRIAELICMAFNSLGKTEFVSVRFGNVLGSRGSVIPIFLEQIKNGGPVTVTHPDMERYFMTIPEAVLLVFQAAVIGKGGEVLVLDMGKPVKILRLAEELIKLQGLKPYEDIEITFTGLRPGEKLFEELLTAEEGTLKTYHEKVFVAKITKKLALDEIENLLNELKITIEENDKERIKKVLEKYVPFYKPKDN